MGSGSECKGGVAGHRRRAADMAWAARRGAAQVYPASTGGRRLAGGWLGLNLPIDLHPCFGLQYT